MKDNNSKNNANQDNFSDTSNDLEYNNKIFTQKNRKDDSLDKFFKQMDNNNETQDILKQLDYLNLSEEKSFEMPQKIFEPLAQKKKGSSNKKENQEKKNVNKDELILYEINNMDNKKDIFNNENKKQTSDEILSNGEDTEKLSEFLLKEKLNRICASIQGYTLNQKCYQNLNNFIQFLPELSKNLYQPIDLLFDVFIELLIRIKQEFKVKENLILKLNTISLNNEGYEKKLIKLNKELKEKEKEIGALINKVNYEKEKTKDNSKSRLLEINSLKKENQQLNNKLTLYKNQIRKSEADYKAIQNKLRYYIFEKENRNNSSSNLMEKNNSNNNEKNNQEDFKINNDKYLAIKKLNMSLVYLLKDINKNICKYDFSLNKIINNQNQGNNNYEIDDLNNNIETNILIDEKNFKNLSKNFMFNMDVINNKIIDILKSKNDILDKDNPKIFNSKIISNINNNRLRTDMQDNFIKNEKKDLSVDNYLNNNSLMKENYNNKKNIQKSDKNDKNSYSNTNNKNTFNANPNNYNNQGFNFNKIGKKVNNSINNKYEYHTRNNNDNNNYNNNSVKKDRKKNTVNFLNFYNNDDKDLEENIETRAVINPKWYDNCKNKKVGYVFDKNKLFTCQDEDDRTNGGNQK